MGSALSPAASDLGLGSNLQQQVADETEEERKKRMAELGQQQSMGQSGSAAVTSLLGPNAGFESTMLIGDYAMPRAGKTSAYKVKGKDR